MSDPRPLVYCSTCRDIHAEDAPHFANRPVIPRSTIEKMWFETDGHPLYIGRTHAEWFEGLSAVLTATEARLNKAEKGWRRIAEAHHDLAQPEHQGLFTKNPDVPDLPECDDYLCVAAREGLASITDLGDEKE